ncbi:MAG: phage holin family protein [Phycisphaerales bacterium]
MIFWRAKELLEGGSDLFRAEAELMSKRVRRLLIGSLFIGITALCALTGIALLTIGIAITLSDRLGWGVTLVSIGGFYVLMCMILYAASLVRSNQSVASASVTENAESETPKERAEDAKDRLENAASSDPDQPESKDEGLFDGIDALKDSAIEVGMKNPVALGSAALLVVSLLGPGKTFKMISRGVAAAGLASTLLDTLGPDQESKPDNA